jgi:class 3 adenylate cyclase
MRRLPSGTVTFVFTDIEGSTRLLQALGVGYIEALQEPPAHP